MFSFFSNFSNVLRIWRTSIHYILNDFLRSVGSAATAGVAKSFFCLALWVERVKSLKKDNRSQPRSLGPWMDMNGTGYEFESQCIQKDEVSKARVKLKKEVRDANIWQEEVYMVLMINPYH